MDPTFLALMMQQMQNTQTNQPEFITPPSPAGPTAAGGQPGQQDLAQMMGAIQAPQAPAPQFSGGVSGSTLPFLQAMPNTLGSALSGSAERVFNQPQLPSLGQLIAGGR